MATTAPKAPSPSAAPAQTSANIYPILTATCTAAPSRFWAIPILGFVFKIIILIPVFIMSWLLDMVLSFILIINSLMVLFTGKYWDTAYTITLDIMRLTTRITFYTFGLTNAYPGFSFANGETFSVEMQKPEHPSRFFAFPLIGGFARGFLLFPFRVYLYIIQIVAGISTILASFVVLFTGKYPNSLFEIERDYVRLTLSEIAYSSGLTEKYPSFHITMNKAVKCILIFAIFLFVVEFGVIFLLGILTPHKNSGYMNTYYPSTPSY